MARPRRKKDATKSTSKTGQDRESTDNRIAETGRVEAGSVTGSTDSSTSASSEDRTGSRRENKETIDGAGKTSTTDSDQRQEESTTEAKAKITIKEVAPIRPPQCSNCGEHRLFDESQRGTQIRCPNCRTTSLLQ